MYVNRPDGNRMEIWMCTCKFNHVENIFKQHIENLGKIYGENLGFYTTS